MGPERSGPEEALLRAAQPRGNGLQGEPPPLRGRAAVAQPGGSRASAAGVRPAGATPLLPKNFDRRFFNAAPPGLVPPGYLKGNEPVLLTHLSPGGQLSFRLPGQRAPTVTVERASAEDVTPDMHLDTVILDTDAHQVLLLWRGHVLLDEGLHDVRGIQVTAQDVSRPKAD
ncbi:MAG TPA: DUF2169 domain-containing protein [Archangium sp.]|nr:DUF2169 domain-containing protein [Archangium sp.]